MNTDLPTEPEHIFTHTPTPRYWHEVPPEERERIARDANTTVSGLMEKFKQPDWCEYPEALAGLMGCWSLILSRHINCIEDCVGCEYNKLGNKYEPN